MRLILDLMCRVRRLKWRVLNSKLKLLSKDSSHTFAKIFHSLVMYFSMALLAFIRLKNLNLNYKFFKAMKMKCVHMEGGTLLSEFT